MDLDAAAMVTYKAVTVVVILAALYLGGGLTEVILATFVGGAVVLVVGTPRALRLGLTIKPLTLGAWHTDCSVFARNRFSAICSGNDTFGLNKARSCRLVRRISHNIRNHGFANYDTGASYAATALQSGFGLTFPVRRSRA
jgi:hypothetical protein